MTESQFIEKNKSHWIKLEQLLTENNTSDADQIISLFSKVSSDLSYAKTYYPRRSVSIYLNSLVNSVFEVIKIRKKENLLSLLVNFYSTKLPQIIIKNKNAFLISFLTFFISFSIGFLSSIKDKDFPKTMLGEDYVAETMENIKKGDPMAIYKDENRSMMFVGITYNNIRVAFLVYILGLLMGVGTIYVMVSNGIMIGAFQAFFHLQNILLTSFLTIWIHGTIEISSIIVAGAAGLILASAIVDPQTFRRMERLRLAAVDSILVLMSTVPLFIVAGFFESYVTRLTDLPDLVKWMIILASLTFIILIYVINPYRYHRQNKHTLFYLSEDELENVVEQKNIIDTAEYSHFQKGLYTLRNNIEKLTKYIFIPFIVVFGIQYYLLIHNYYDFIIENSFDYLKVFYDFSLGGWELFLTSIIAFYYLMGVLKAITKHGSNFKLKDVLIYIKSNIIYKTLLFIPILAILYFTEYYISYIVFFIFPLLILVIINENSDEENYNYNYFKDDVKDIFRIWASFVLPTIFLFFVYYILSKLTSSSIIVYLVKELSDWHYLADNGYTNGYFIATLVRLFATLIMISVFYFYYKYLYFQLRNEIYSDDIINDIDYFRPEIKLND